MLIYGKLILNSIYRATEGEGVHIGTPQVFVLLGCHIGCVNCDSTDTWDFEDQLGMTMDKALVHHEKANKGRVRRVSITGGDPSS